MIVVTGATGNVGRTLVRTLAAAGERVTAVARRAVDGPETAGVRHRQADLAVPESLAPALDGADALFLLVAGDDPQAILGTAKAAGVRRVVLLSTQGAGTRPASYPHPVAFEEAVRGSGLDWTVLRPTGFASNALRWAEPVRAHRTVAAPFGDVGLPVIDPDDIAEAASVVLRDAGHAGRTHVLTGPSLVTPRDQAAAIGAAIGAPVRFVEQSRAEARAGLLRAMPESVADSTLDILGAPSAEEVTVSPAVEDLLGRPAGTFADWAALNAAVFY
ncbi:NAD(P)H-binding protein [Longispora sp. K20-0274]|uniref:NAD(P)H-binding protein n=1 Tax=Longispora sp. K20-0274 TaxID=3088255 RepID=UPI00399A3A41